MQRMLFDLKERKFELNIYLNPVAREAYSRYLARQFPNHEGMPIQSVRWHLGTQGILPPVEAVAKQRLHEDKAHIQLLNEFNVAAALSSTDPSDEPYNGTAIANLPRQQTPEDMQ